jgi:hypothetical protein
MVVPANVGRRSSASSKIAVREYRLGASEGARVDVTRIHPDKPVDGFSLTDVTGDCRKGISLANVRRAEIRNVNVSGLSGALLSIHNVSGKGLNGAAMIDGPALPDPVPVPAEPYRLR